MEFKDSKTLFKHLERLAPLEPKIILLSGDDIDLGEGLLEKTQLYCEKNFGSYEAFFFVNETGEHLRLQSELKNQPLWPSPRFFLIRQSEEILKPILGNSRFRLAFAQDLKNLGEQNLCFFLYAGKVPSSFLKILKEQKHFLHLANPKLYPNQVEEKLKQAIQVRKLNFSPEAFYFLLDNVEAKLGKIEQALDRIKRYLSFKEKIEAKDIGSILFPHSGWNVFALVDALFSHNLLVASREYRFYKAPEDSYFLLLKLLLRRIDTIRKARIAYKANVKNSELLQILEISNRPPFIQKEILQRLRKEISLFSVEKENQLYDTLIKLQKNFRLHAPQEHQSTLFQVFFDTQ